MITVVLANVALLTHPSLIPTEGLEMPGGSASKAPPDLNTVTWLQSWCAALSNFFFSLCITEAASMSWTAGRSKKKQTTQSIIKWAPIEGWEEKVPSRWLISDLVLWFHSGFCSGFQRQQSPRRSLKGLIPTWQLNTSFIFFRSSLFI